jgi:hypothetical protein
MLSVCVVEQRVAVSNIKKLIVAQQCFYGEFMSPATVKRNYTLLYFRSSRKVWQIFVRF